MSLVAYALCTVDNAKNFIGLTNNNYDTVLEMLINQATDFIEKYCDRRFKETTYTDEVYDGTDDDAIVLKQFPVTTFTELEYNANFNNSASWNTIDSEDYWIDTDTGIVTKVNKFVKGKQKYRATYVAGYSTIPYDLQYACLMFVSEAFNKRKAGGIKTESLGDHSISFESLLMTDSTVQKILNGYRKVNVA